MAELAASGLTSEQLALVMELSASLATEARPVVDEAAQRRRARDREYQANKRQPRRQSRQKSAESADPLPPYEVSSTPPDSPVISDEITSPSELKVEHVVGAWNELAERVGLRKVARLTPERRQKIGVRIRQNTVEDFTEAIAAIGRSPFLRGDNDRGWAAQFDWMLEPKNFTKLIEGNYDKQPDNRPPPSRGARQGY